MKYLVSLGLFLIVAIGISVKYYNDKREYSVCFYDALERRPDCSLVVKARSYHLEGGCATFYPGEESVCGILLIAPNAPK